MTTWKPRLIPRKTLSARRSTQSLDAHGIPTSSYTYFTMPNSGIQPMGAHERMALESGLRDKRAYKVFSTTEVSTTNEGTLQQGDELELYCNWCEIISVDIWDYGLQSHYEIIAVEKNER